jgi:hypothetical protein
MAEIVAPSLLAPLKVLITDPTIVLRGDTESTARDKKKKTTPEYPKY